MAKKPNHQNDELATDLIPDGEAIELNMATPDLTTETKPTQKQPGKQPSLGVYLTKKVSTMPKRASENAACYDLSIAVAYGEVYKQFDITDDNHETVTAGNGKEIRIDPYSRIIVPLGVKLDIPEGYAVKLHIRSGMAAKYGLTLVNNTGIIDQDYRGELMAIVENNTNTRYYFDNGTRIVQMEIFKPEILELEELTEYDNKKSERGEGGLGSTGEKI